MAPAHQVITWDYQFAPNAQKSRNYLYATGTPFKICEQPFVMPRPILHNIGITYRRVPVNSIGKDIFCDNVSFIEALQELLEKEGKGLKRSAFDMAFDAWGYRSFWVSLPTVPASLITKDLAKDRADLFPVFARDDFAGLRQNGLSELRAMLDTAEKDFLNGPGPWIGGASECGVADVYASWIIKWALQTLDHQKEPGFGKDAYPKVHRWVEGFPSHDEEAEKGLKIDEKEATKLILGSEYAMPDIGVDATDPLHLKAGEPVGVEATDAKPGTYPQLGKLVGLNKQKVVIEVDNGIRVHFPRVGYHILKQSEVANGH